MRSVMEGVVHSLKRLHGIIKELGVDVSEIELGGGKEPLASDRYDVFNSGNMHDNTAKVLPLA